MKTALVLGANGQDGSYLCELLLEKGYVVHAAVRRSSVDNLVRLRGVRNRVVLHYFDLADGSSISRVLHDASPDEVYSVGDQDHVGSSWETPQYSLQVTAGGALRVLEAVRRYDSVRNSGLREGPDYLTRLYQPASATMFGDSPCPQSETSPINPQSPYAIAKYAAYQLARTYRAKYGMFVACGILYNHDSPRRGPGYLLGDLVRGALDVKHGRAKTMAVKDMDAYVDIGFAGDYMEGVWRMMQQPEPDDFVFSSGEVWQVRDIVNEVVERVGVSLGHVVSPPAPSQGYRGRLMGDYRKAQRLLGWVPKMNLQTLLKGIIKEISKEYE